MAKVSQSQLVGNYGAALVAKRLSSECLVRPVATDTDVGVDLYCESLDDGAPFLHFWVQVKAGQRQITVSADGSSASCSLDLSHIDYWSRQPVPVYLAMVPIDWPVSEEPQVFLADISSRAVMTALPCQKTMTIQSDLWPLT